MPPRPSRSSPFGKKWTPSGSGDSRIGNGMHSAYVLANGEEPDFTNNAIIKDLPQFTETLDYIFVSDHWHVSNVKQLPIREKQNGSIDKGYVNDVSLNKLQVDIEGKAYPDAEQPSDHLMIAATLSLK